MLWIGLVLGPELNTLIEHVVAIAQDFITMRQQVLVIIV